MSLNNILKNLTEAISNSEDYADVIADFLSGHLKKMASRLNNVPSISDFIDFSVSEIGEKKTLNLLKGYFKYK
jgi:hypothetical protein